VPIAIAEDPAWLRESDATCANLSHMAEPEVGSRVTIQIWEPFELIADAPLDLSGTITEVRGGVHPSLVIALDTIDPRLDSARFAVTSARHMGDSVGTLVVGQSTAVHGAFYAANLRDQLDFGFIGGLKVISAAR
jgi:hypothetical protein